MTYRMGLMGTALLALSLGGCADDAGDDLEVSAKEAGLPDRPVAIVRTSALQWEGEQTYIPLYADGTASGLVVVNFNGGLLIRPAIPWQHTTLLAGHVDQPGQVSGSTKHTDRSERAERLSKAIADLIDREESLLSRAAAHLDLLLQHDLGEWRDILARYPRHRLKEFLTSDSPRAQRLRQSSPFFAVLRPEERDAVLDAIEGPG